MSVFRPPFRLPPPVQSRALGTLSKAGASSKTLYLRSEQTNAIGAGYYDINTSAGASVDTAVVTTVASSGFEFWTKTAGGTVVKWVSPPIAAGVTLTSVDVSVWVHESDANVNIRPLMTVYHRSVGGTETSIGFDNHPSESATTATEYTFSVDVTDTAFAEDERIVFLFLADAFGTMGAGTATLTFNAADAATGDSFVTVFPSVEFKAEAAGGQTLTPSLYANTNTFYAATVSPGAVTLTPSLYVDADTFYSATVASSYDLAPGLYSDADTFYAPTVAPGAVALTPAIYADADTFYAATVAPGAVTLAPGLYADADVFYAPTVATGDATLLPSLYADSDVFHSPTVAPGAVALLPGLYADPDAFYSPTVSADGATQTLVPSLFTDGDTFYALTVTPGAVSITPALYVDADAFHAPTVAGLYELTPSLLGSGVVFYSATVATGVVTLTPAFFVDPDAFYAAAVTGGTVSEPPGNAALTNIGMGASAANSDYGASLTNTGASAA